jgi:hypothetical protein
MALTATFQADFQKFKSAVNGATNDLKKFDRDTSTAVGSVKAELSGTGTAFKALGPIIAGVLSVTALKGAISSFANFASHVQDLSNKTGIGVEALQRLKFAADQNGGSLDQVANAISKLGQNLSGGQKNAVGAINALGLGFDEIRRMQPDQAFASIAQAINKIEDPMARSKIAMDLFGKAGADLLPMIRDGFVETMEAADRLGIVLSEDTIKAGDTFADTMVTLTAVGKATIANVLVPMIPALTELAQWMGENLPRAIKFATDALQIGLPRALIEAKIAVFELLVEMAKLGEKMPTFGNAMGLGAKNTADMSARLQHARDQLMLFDQATVSSTSANKAAAPTIAALNLNYADLEKKSAAAAKAAKKFWEEAKKLNAQLKEMTAIFPVVTDVELDNVTLKSRSIEEAAKLNKELEEWAQRNGAVEPTIEAVSTAVEDQIPKLAQLTAALKTNLGKALGDIPKTIADGFIHGNIGGAVKSIVSQVGSAVGSSVGAMFGPIGAKIGGAIGSMAGMLTNPFKKLFGIGVNEEVKKANKEIETLRQSLLKQHGTMENLEAQAKKVGLSFQANWGHQGQAGLKAFNALMEEFEKRTKAAGRDGALAGTGALHVRGDAGRRAHAGH